MSDEPKQATAPMVGWTDVGGEKLVSIAQLADGFRAVAHISPAGARTIAMQLLIVADAIDRAAPSPPRADTAGPAAAADGGAGDSPGRG